MAPLQPHAHCPRLLRGWRDAVQLLWTVEFAVALTLFARSRLAPRGPSLVEQLRALRLRQHEGAEEDASDADEHEHMAASNAAAAPAGGGGEAGDDEGGASYND